MTSSSRGNFHNETQVAMLRMPMRTRWIIPALLAILVIISIGLRVPMIREGKPFFYQEDEAHHFNRLVEMVKQGTFDPQYFHKPSLHFYLRMPAVYVGILLEKWSRPDQSIAKIKTRDRYGLAKYSFSWSHPLVVMAVRAVSVLLVTLTLLLVYGMARELGMTYGPALTAVVIYLFSPEVYRYSAFIGVDTPLMFFCCLASFLALRWKNEITTQRIWIIGLTAGLAVSSKYNGLPIAALPLFLLLANKEKRNVLNLIAAIAAPAIGFFAGSPYILLSFDLFYKQLSYEAWHYAIAGHEGHMAEPGFAQVIHYSKWLAGDGIGLGAALFVPFGIIALFKRDSRAALIFASFPLAFFALMCAQRANFVRNMLPIVPYGAIFAAYFISSMIEYVPTKRIQNFIFEVGVLIGLLMPQSGMRNLINTPEHIDTRETLETWAREQNDLELAVDGELQPQQSLLEIPGVSRFDPPGNYEELFQSGVTTLALSRFAPRPSSSSVIQLEPMEMISGDPSEQRVLKSPSIDLFHLSFLPQAANLEVMDAPFAEPQGNESEPYRWISKRISKLHVANAPTQLSFELMSPWKDQRIILSNGSWREEILLNQKNPGEWITVVAKIPQKEVLFEVQKVQSPAEHGLSADTRRLGVAIKSIVIKDR